MRGKNPLNNNIVIPVSIGFSKVNYHVPTYVTRKKPIEIKRIASWLRNSPYRDDSVLMTKRGWQSSYLPLYFPEIGSFRERYFIIGSILVSSAMLEDYLKNYHGTLLLISHDRDFLDSVINQILHISGQQVAIYNGNYSSYENYRTEQIALQQAGYAKQQNHIEHLLSTSPFIIAFKSVDDHQQ